MIGYIVKNSNGQYLNSVSGTNYNWFNLPEVFKSPERIDGIIEFRGWLINNIAYEILPIEIP